MILTNYTDRLHSKNGGKIIGIVGAFLILVFPCVVMWTSDNVEISQSFCPIKMLTGMPCPGCGITKSMIFAYKGDVFKSLSYNIWGYPAIVACVLAIVVLNMEIITGKEYFQKILYSGRLAYILAFMLGVYHFVRVLVFIYHHSLIEILKESIWM